MNVQICTYIIIHFTTIICSHLLFVYLSSQQPSFYSYWLIIYKIVLLHNQHIATQLHAYLVLIIRFVGLICSYSVVLYMTKINSWTKEYSYHLTTVEQHAVEQTFSQDIFYSHWHWQSTLCTQLDDSYSDLMSSV